MKEIALLHTVRTVAESFGPALQATLPEPVKIYNLWDEFLAVNPNEIGEFTMNNKNRLFLDLKSAEMTGADLIVVTCSTLTPYLKEIRKFISVPVVAIDDAMTKKAVSLGSRFLVLATAESTLEPTADKLLEDAAAAGKEICIDKKAVMEAFFAMKSGDMETHDRLLKAEAEKISGYDCIVIAQASMAHLEGVIREITGIETLSSPKLCMELVRGMLAE